jgi:hypothetical protein
MLLWTGAHGGQKRKSQKQHTMTGLSLQGMVDAMSSFVVSKFNEGFSPGKTMKMLMAAGVCNDHAHIEALVWWEWDYWLYKVRRHACDV